MVIDQVSWSKTDVRYFQGVIYKVIGVSLGCSLFWPISEQREEMNPVPATKTIKRLYYYKVNRFFIYLLTLIFFKN